MNPVTSSILQRLVDRDGFVSGGELCRELRITRSAVWKHVAQLREAGYSIDAVSGRGYRLAGLTGAPVAEEVQPLLDTLCFGRRLTFLDTTDSTNLQARAMAREGAEEGAVVVADSQTGGRGRMRRAWASPPGVNLYGSIVLRPPVPTVRVPEIPLVAAAAIHEALASECPALAPVIKWPNDILCGGRKLCGILCEMESEPDFTHFVVVGFGLNVNLDPVPEELQGIATSLCIEAGASFSRARLLAAVLNRFERLYTEWLNHPDLGFLLPGLEKHAWLQGKAVRIEQFDRIIAGTAAGLSPQGHLLLRGDDGAVTAVSSGEAHIQSINDQTRPA
ncbi:MAG: biotin--[acetyl-CoA-carboxylase] ligase [Chlorobiaceae bacterium]|nr:biotin--[acetyl-CoA-carboxylase] ligase [Chlorobiaceae bacterium]